MDAKLADQLGRELAWVESRRVGLVTDDMAKTAGLFEGLVYAPLTGIAALLSAPFGSKLKNLGVGLLMGAGMGALSTREVQNRQQSGEPVRDQDMSPAMKAIMAGAALGGSSRITKSLAEGKGVSEAGAMLAGAPLGALLASDPMKGFLVGGISGKLLSAFGQANPGQNPFVNLLPPAVLPQAPAAVSAQKAISDAAQVQKDVAQLALPTSQQPAGTSNESVDAAMRKILQQASLSGQIADPQAAKSALL